MDLAVEAHEDSGAGPDVLPCSIPAAPGSRLAFSWGTGTQLRVAEVLSPTTGVGGQEPFAGICQWGITTGEQRRIAYQIMPLYRRLKRQLMSLGPSQIHEAKEARRQYSAAVLDVLSADASDPTLGPPASDAGLQVAYEAALWQLTEMFFLRSDAEDGYLAEAFAAWFTRHGSLFTDPAGYDALGAQAARLAQLGRAELDPAYWPTLHRLVLLGRLEEAMALLTAHPAYQLLGDPAMAAKVKALDAAYTLLRRVPRLMGPAGSASSALLGGAGMVTGDPVAFGSERAEWQASVDKLFGERRELLSDLMSHDMEAAKGLDLLLRLLCAGSPSPRYAQEGARLLAATAHNWVELLVGSLLWQHPALPSLELRALLGQVRAAPGLMTRESDGAFLDFFEQLLLAECGQEVQAIINLATNNEYSGLQFVVHIYEVLAALPAAGRVISRPLPHLGCDQAESFTLHYAEALMGPDTTWALAAEYLAWCPVYGGDVMEALLARTPAPLQSQQEALAAVSLAQRHGLTAAAQDLARRLGMAAAQAGQMAAALVWALRAHDASLAAQLVQPLVAKVQQELLAQVGSCAAAPLDLPELQDLEPLLVSLSGPAADEDEDDGMGGFGQQHSQAGWELKLQQQQQSCPQQPYPELAFLSAVLRLQQALQEVRRCQQPEQQEQPAVLDGALGGVASEESQQHRAALAQAYQGVRQPVRQLLLDGQLAPAALRLPLLLYITPLCDSEHAPFSRADILGLMQLLSAASSGLPAVAAAVLREGATCGGGAEWAAAQGDLDAAALTAARLALCRALARVQTSTF